MIFKHLIKKTIGVSMVLFFTTPFYIDQLAYGQESAIQTTPESIELGKELFKQNCKSCHAIETRLLGPPLKDVYKRRELPWIFAFVKNSQKVIASGDEYAVQLYEEYNKLEMTSFPSFSNEEISSILAYIKYQADNPPEVEKKIATSSEEGTSEDLSKVNVNTILLSVVIILAVVLIVAIILFSMSKIVLKKKGLPPTVVASLKEQNGLFRIIKNKVFIGMITAVVTAVVIKVTIDALYDIGVQEGYTPTQPIKFSHKVHAGDYKIDCNYCHTGVAKSKNANIPSLNICMNCHSAIDEGANTGKEEIQKIYTAIENNKPIEWVRVHNLPDLAYFNHSQHYKVGGVDCQTCHGPIEEMEVVEQHENLTMGWCINCHKDTPLNTEGNGYYDELMKIHDGEKEFTVADNGGLDCAKCHY